MQIHRYVQNVRNVQNQIINGLLDALLIEHLI